MLSTITLINLFLITAGILYLAKKTFFRKRCLTPLPPGPKPKPIVGNLLDLPPRGVHEWQHWLKHKELYGPISSVSLFGQTLIIVNDVQMAIELMEKRSAIHSSRPRMVFAGEMVGWENSTGLLTYSSSLRTHRKNIHGVIGSKFVISQLHALQDIEVRRFLLRVLENPTDLVQHLRNEAGAIILKVTYGYTIEPHKGDPLVKLIEEGIMQVVLAAVPGAWLVDVIPACTFWLKSTPYGLLIATPVKYLPDWMPGAGFKRTAATWRKTAIEVADKPFGFVKQQMAQRTNKPSYVSKLLAQNDGNLSAEEEHMLKWSAASLYGGGADTVRRISIVLPLFRVINGL
jgi:hypothetical protein